MLNLVSKTDIILLCGCLSLKYSCQSSGMTHDSVVTSYITHGDIRCGATHVNRFECNFKQDAFPVYAQMAGLLAPLHMKHLNRSKIRRNYPQCLCKHQDMPMV